jgi:hypothetical protein
LELTDPRETELNLLWVIHEQGLCRSGSVDVAAGPGGAFTVRGVVDTTEQLQALQALLNEEVRGLFALDVHTADDVVANAASVPGLELQRPLSAARPAPGEALILAWLKTRNIAGQQAIRESNRIATQAVSLANEAWMESWALRRLVERFGPEDRQALRLTSQARLAEMTQLHLNALEKAVAQERELLLPILGGDDAASSATDSRLADTARLCRMIQDAFASGGTADAADFATLRDLLTATSSKPSP